MGMKEFIWLTGYRPPVRKAKEGTHSWNLEHTQSSVAWSSVLGN